MSDDDTGSTEERIDRLEAGQHTLSEKIDQILGIVSGKPGRPDQDTGTAGPGGRPSTEEMVSMELDRRDREKAAAAAAEAEKSDRETIKEQLAALREAAPVPPQPRSQRIMWGARR